jgi:hypothetical protein
MTIEISDTGRGSTRSLATGRKLVPIDRTNYQGIEGGFEESNI